IRELIPRPFLRTTELGGASFELRHVAIEVATHLVQAVAAELLEHRVGEDDGEHRFTDDAGRGEGNYIAAFANGVAGIASADVDAAERLHQARQGLHRDTHDQWRTGGDATLEA